MGQHDSATGSEESAAGSDESARGSTSKQEARISQQLSVMCQGGALVSQPLNNNVSGVGRDSLQWGRAVSVTWQ